MKTIGYFYKQQLPLLTNNVERFHTKSLNTYYNLEQIDLYFDEQSMVEDRDDVIQLICATVILTKDGYILTVKKPLETDSSTTLKNERTSLYLGGHLDIYDTEYNNTDTFITTMKREVSEEINYNITNDTILTPFITYTPVSKKMANHIGIIFPVVIDNPFDLTMDSKHQWLPIDRISEITTPDPWSLLIAKRLSKYDTKNIELSNY